MTQRKTGKQPGRKKARKKQTAGKRKASPRKRSIAHAGARKKSSASAEKGAWSSAREEQHRLKREAILRVASRLINRKGYAGMSLADIAGELAIRNASLYHYFESKEDLVFACYERSQRIVGETLGSVEKSRGSGLEAIERYVVSMRERMRESGELPLANRVWALGSAHMKAIIASELEHERRVAGLVERGIADGSIRPCNVALTTTMLFSALRAVPRQYLRVDPEEWQELDKDTLVTVRRFLGARGD
jgi:AcrR family transcriptional regulator